MKLLTGVVMCLMYLSQVASVEIPPDKLKLIEQVRMNKEEFERARDVHEKWYSQAVNSLMGAMGRELYMKMEKEDRKAFLSCLDYSGDEKDLRDGAECVVNAHDGTLRSHMAEKRRRRRKRSAVPNSLKSFVVRNKLDKRLGSPRLQRLRQGVVDKKVESAKSRKSNVARSRHVRSHRLSRLREEKREYVEDLGDVGVKHVDVAPALLSTRSERTPVKRITSMISTLVKGENPAWKEISDYLKNMNDMHVLSKKQSTYGTNLRDIVTDYDPKYRKKLSFLKRYKNFLPDGKDVPRLMKDAYQLANVLDSHSDMVNAKVLSPRFMPLLDNTNDGDTAHVLSPNILPFYKDQSPNSVLPLPDLIDSTGLKADDRDAILDLIMQMSGAEQIVEDTFRIFKNKDTSRLMDDVDKTTDAIDRIHKRVKSMMTHRQKRELAQRKYTFLNVQQMRFLYGDEGLYNSTLEQIDINEYAKWTERDKKLRLMQDLRTLANDVGEREDSGNGTERTSRKKRLTVLAPFVFGPGIGAPLYLGPTVLSPNLFSPAILSPFMLSPPTLTPSVGSPLVLSPYFLSPNVLSAATFEVYILSPYFIAPNVINPYLMSPIILSPHMLCPDVVSPTLLSGAVLNPYFLSPAIFTQSALAADILSPSFMSRKRRRKRSVEIAMFRVAAKHRQLLTK